MSDSQDMRNGNVTESSQDAEQSEKRRVLGEDLRKEYKPKKRRKPLLTAIVVILALVIVGVAAYFSLNFAPEPEVIPDTSVTLTQYNTSDIAQVDIQLRDGDQYSIVYDEATAKYLMKDALDSVSYNSTYLRDVYTAATSLTASRIIEENVADLAPYGLDKPYSTMTVHNVNGQSQVFELGNKLPTGSGWYLRVQGENTVYQLTDSMGTYMSRAVITLRDLNQLPTLNADAAEFIRIEKQEGTTMELQIVEDSASINPWHFIEPAGLEAEAESVTALWTTISSIKLNAYVDTPTSFVAYGLDTPTATVTLRDSEGGELILHVGSAANDTSTYVRIADSPDVYTMENSYLSFIKDTTLVTLVVKFISLVNITAVDQVEILSTPANSYTMRIDRTKQLDENGKVKTLDSGEIDYKEAFLLNDEAVSEMYFKKVYQDIIGLMIRGEVKGEVTAQSEYTLHYTFNSKQDTTKIEFIPYQQDFYAIRKNDGPVLFFTLKESVKALMDDVDLLVASPTPDQLKSLNKVVITRGEDSKTFTLDELGSDAMAKMGETFINITTSGITHEKAGDLVATIEYHFSNGSEPIVMEYTQYQSSLYSYAPVGQSARYYMTGSTLDRNLSDYLDK